MAEIIHCKAIFFQFKKRKKIEKLKKHKQTNPRLSWKLIRFQPTIPRTIPTKLDAVGIYYDKSTSLTDILFQGRENITVHTSFLAEVKT